MNTKQKKRLMSVFIIMLLVSAAFTLILFSLKQNINLFYTPTQVSQLSEYPKHAIRLGGYVKKQTVHYPRLGENVSFVITDRTKEIEVIFHGILPNLFKEGQTVIVTGKLNRENKLIASQVLAKHDEKYFPKGG